MTGGQGHARRFGRVCHSRQRPRHPQQAAGAALAACEIVVEDVSPQQRMQVVAGDTMPVETRLHQRELRQ